MIYSRVRWDGVMGSECDWHAHILRFQFNKRRKSVLGIFMTYVLAGGENLDVHSLAFICISNKEWASGGSQNPLTHNNKITASAISATAALDCWGEKFVCSNYIQTHTDKRPCLKEQFTRKWQLCHHLFILMTFQVRMILFFSQNIRDFEQSSHSSWHATA